MVGGGIERRPTYMNVRHPYVGPSFKEYLHYLKVSFIGG
jgi:hypothetical protein